MFSFKKGIKKFNIAFLLWGLIILQSGSLSAKSWFEIFRDSTYSSINSVTSVSGDLRNLIAVGEGGDYYNITDFGHWMERRNTGFPENLNTVGYAKSYQGADSLLLAAGENGRVLYYDFNGDSWHPVDTLGNQIFHSTAYDFSNEVIYLAGDNSTVYSSNDFGGHWQRVTVDIPDLSIVQVVSGMPGTLIIGTRNDSTFILQKVVGTPVFSAVNADTLPDFSAKAVQFIMDMEYNTNLYIAGNLLSTSEGQVWVKEYLDGYLHAPTLCFLGFLNGDITSIGGTRGYSGNFMWLSTQQGEIWESADRGNNWYLKYLDPEQRKLGPLFILGDMDTYSDFGLVFGDEGLILKYGFELLWFYPHRNAHVDYMMDRIELHFSSPADIDSVRKGIFLSSSISGRVPFTVEYESNDSSQIYLFPNRQHGDGAVPSERWQMLISDRIRERFDQSNEPFPTSSNWFDILPFQGSGFKFQASGKPIAQMRIISNPVVGFFDNDDLFDLLFYANDSLYCYSTDRTGNINFRARFYIGPLITLTSMIDRQLVADDINGDGKLDLLLFDQASINIIENHSDTQFNFVTNPRTYFTTQIKQIIPYYADYNEQRDLLVLNDSLFTLYDISFNGFGSSKSIAETNARQFKKVELGDVDLDGKEDLAILMQNGSLELRRGSGYGSFLDTYTPSETGYKDISFADLDNDSDLEVVAFTPNEVNAYTFEWSDKGSFLFSNLYTISGGQNISAMTIQNFGNGNRNLGPLMMDIAILTTDSLIVLENQTTMQDNYQFAPNPESLLRLPFAGKGIMYADFNADALIDLLIYDDSHGQMDVWYKVTWKPTISNVLYHSKQVIELQWDPPPSEQGVAQFYRVRRDSVPFFDDFGWIRDVNETFFRDSTVAPYDTYWYSIAAVFDGGRESLWSDPVRAELFIKLDTVLTTDLTDTNRIYLARSDVQIPSGNSVTLGPGINLMFDNGAGLDVFGHLEVGGNGIDDNMVEFFGKRESDEISWRGITLHPAADTVVFDWFSVSNANTGIKAINRPLKISRGGMQFNQVALEVTNDTLALANILLDSNMVAADFKGDVQASLKNLTIMHSFESGLHIGVDSRVEIRNSVLWFNEGPSIVSEIPKDHLFISYSTVDSVSGPVTGVEITREAPIVLPPDSGFCRMDKYSPTIDAGFPGDDVGDEPQPNGGRINQGVFGGLFVAAPTLAPRIESSPGEIVQQIRPGFSDTTLVYLSNPGGEPLEIISIGLVENSGAFSLGNISGPIQPGESITLPVLFTPHDRIDYQDTILIITNDTRVFSRNKRIPLNGRGLNAVPVIPEAPPSFTMVDEPYEFAINAIDDDGDSLVYTAVELPDWLNLSSQGVLSGTPSPTDAGRHPVRVEINDGHGGIIMLDYSITVILNANSPLAPRTILTEFPSRVVFQSGVKMDFIVTDNNQELIDWNDVRIRYYLQNLALDDLPPIVDTTGINSVSYLNLEDGNYLFKVWAYDSLGRGFTGEKADSVEFEVRTFERNVHRNLWYMISFPRGMTFNWEQFNYPDSLAMLLTWDNEEEDYLPLERDNIPPGTGFWILPMENLSFDLSSYNRLQPGDEAVDILTVPLQKGWNQVGTPVDYSTAWKDMMFHADSTGQDYTLPEAVQQGFLEGAVHWFIQFGSKQGYNLVELDTSALAYPWLAYWIKTTTTGTITFTTKPSFRDVVIPTSDTTLMKPLAGEDGKWKVNISLQNKNYADMTNILGAGGDQARSVQEPPPFGEYCAFYFTDNKGRSSISYKTDKAGFTQAISWDAVVESRNGQAEHILEWDVSAALDQGIHLVLLDRQKEKIIPMDEQSSYTFVPGQRYYKFRIYASTDASFKPEIIPLNYRLEQNYPNPFNPSTTIRFGVPEDAAGKSVALKIYDVLGREVVTLVNSPLKAGYHQVEWNGRNNQGQAVSSGIYFYRLQNGNTTRQVRKMILLR